MDHPGVRRASFVAGALAALLPAAMLWSASPAGVPASGPAGGGDGLEPPRYRLEDPRRTELLGADAQDLKALGTARQLAQQGAFDPAFEIFQALLEKSDAAFLPVGEGAYLPMDYVVAGEMAVLGEPALEAYRAAHAATAAMLYDRALRAGDEAQLQRVAYQYVHTPAGASALERLGSLAFDRGDFPRAAACWVRLIRLRGLAPARAMLLARTVVAWRLAGRSDLAKPLAQTLRRRFPDAAGEVGMSRRNLADFVDETLSRPGAATRPADGDSRTDEDGVGAPTAPDSKAGIVLATRWVNPPLPEKGKPLDLTAKAIGGPEPRGREETPVAPILRKGQVVLGKAVLPGVICPVVTGELAIYRGDTHVTACDLLTGDTAWSVRLPLLREPAEVADSGWVGMGGYRDGENGLGDAGQHRMTLAEGKLFVRYGIPRVITGADSSSGLAAISAGLPPQGGKILWEVGFRAGEGFLHELQFTSPPAVRQGRLYVQAYHGLKCCLVCLEAGTGKLLWERWICDAPREDGGMDIPWRRGGNAAVHGYQRGSRPALAGGTVIALPNTGVVVAVDAADGRLLWARRYDDAKENPNSEYGEFTRPTAAVNPVLALGDRIICLPADRGALLALDAQDGRELWRKVQTGPSNARRLAAVDSERFLLLAPGLEVRSAATGEPCHKPINVKDVNGRPARMGRFILASGSGRLHRLDLDDYSHTALPLEDPSGLLGNLAVSGQTLLAANAVGLCAYFEYDDACRRLDDRIAKAARAEVGGLLLQRATLAFHAKAFDRSAADLEAARAAATEQFDTGLLERVGGWTHRLQTARGNLAGTPEEALEWFQKALGTAPGPAEKAAATLRLAKAYEKCSTPAAAAALAQQLSETFGAVLIGEVSIGPNAPVWAGPDEALAPAGDRATAFLADLIRQHGREVYAGFDREAAAALEKARADQNPDAVLAVAQRWPLSLSAPAARYAAAELFCLLALKDSIRQEEFLGNAFAQLSDLSASEDPVVSLQARLAIRVIRLRLAGTNAPPSLPDTLPSNPPEGAFSFLDAKASFRDAIQALRAGKIPGK
ncbi:MAG: PQQ-binding-like beta-propeller repeat protein [Planctomycetota bacterium]|nr:PQQ-binding-like beta-propeller repeat protein [Planctomycetota bacterium]